MQDPPGPRRLLWPRLAALALLAAVLAAFTLGGGERLFPPLVDWIRGLGWRGALLYAALYLPAALLMLPSSPITMGAGYLFGFGPGLLLGSPAAAASASLTMLVARSLGRPLAAALARRVPRFDQLAAAIDRHWFEVIVLLRVTPLVPFPIFNWALGLTRLGPARFALASVVGMFPGNLAYAWLGSKAPEAAALLRSPAQLLGVKSVAITLGLVAFTALVVWLAGRRIALALAEAEREKTP